MKVPEAGVEVFMMSNGLGIETFRTVDESGIKASLGIEMFGTVDESGIEASLSLGIEMFITVDEPGIKASVMGLEVDLSARWSSALVFRTSSAAYGLSGEGNHIIVVKRWKPLKEGLARGRLAVVERFRGDLATRLPGVWPSSYDSPSPSCPPLELVEEPIHGALNNLQESVYWRLNLAFGLSKHGGH